jgi:hypothetical protein
MGGLIPLGGDCCEIGTDDPTLVLDCPARTLLRDLFRHALLVHPSVHLRPRDLARVFALEEERGIFGRCESEDLEVRGELCQISVDLRFGERGRTLLSPRTNSLPLLGYIL